MTFQLPTYTAPAAGWQLTDYKPRVILTATADSFGAATATGPVIEPGFRWLIQRAVVSTSTASANPQVRLYDGSVSQQNLLSGSNSATYDEADYPTGLMLEQSTQLLAVFAGAHAGDTCCLRLQVAVLSLVSS